VTVSLGDFRGSVYESLQGSKTVEGVRNGVRINDYSYVKVKELGTKDWARDGSIWQIVLLRAIFT
jgi:hypothetical protein